MAMFNPPHPGEFIQYTYLEQYGISIRELSRNLNISATTFARIIKKVGRVTPEMSLRLSKTLGGSPESWLQMQLNYDLFHAKKSIKLGDVKIQKIPTERETENINDRM